tara:strand:- start:3930 stop:4187 length:258 start_codon:yes stop_codon:yes gene_type:complete
MGEGCNTKEGQKAENKLPTSYLSATCMSVDNEQTVKPFVQQTTIHSSKDLGAALRAYYNTVPDHGTTIQTIQLHRPASMQPDNKK